MFRDVFIRPGLITVPGRIGPVGPNSWWKLRKPFTEAKIIDTQTGRIVPRGTHGEICTRGYCVFKGYWNDPEKTAETVDEDGWYHSGDVGYLTEDGGLVVTGRSKEMIIRGGENIYPAEIENVLLQMKEINDAHVIGVPDERFGEEVAAYIKGIVYNV